MKKKRAFRTFWLKDTPLIVRFDTSEEAHILSLVPEAGREVALSKVVEQGHEASRALPTRDPFDAHHVGTGGLADKKARAGEPHLGSSMIPPGCAQSIALPSRAGLRAPAARSAAARAPAQDSARTGAAVSVMEGLHSQAPRSHRRVGSVSRSPDGKDTTAAGERVSPIVAGERSGCTASGPSSHPGRLAWRRRPRPPAR